MHFEIMARQVLAEDPENPNILKIQIQTNAGDPKKEQSFRLLTAKQTFPERWLSIIFYQELMLIRNLLERPVGDSQ